MNEIGIAIAQLRQDEGFRRFPYLDTKGISTIGYGRNLRAEGISPDEARVLLENDVQRVEEHLYTFPWWDGLSVARRAVLINMAVNMGVDGLLQFREMIAALQTGDYNAAAEAMLNSVWARQVGDRAVRLAGIMGAQG